MTLSLPPYTLIMSDYETRQLACDVTELLSEEVPHVLAMDFLAPVYDAIAAMFELDWKRDLGTPANTNRLLLDALQESTEGDVIKDLERWFIDKFGPYALGNMTRERALANNEVADYCHVFRDSTPEHTTGFLGPLAKIARRDCLFVHLGSGRTVGPPSIDLFVATACTSEEIIQRIRSVL